MKRYKFIPCLLLAALLCGCGKQEVPVTVPSTFEDTPSETQPLTPDTADPSEAAPTVSDPTTEATTETQPVIDPTLPLLTVPEPTQGATVCGHDYQQTFYEPPFCEQSGALSFRCSKCGDLQQQISLPLGHSYADATCTVARTCTRCNSTDGFPLGHDYADGICSRCGMKDPGKRTITIQVKDSKNAPVDGVTVELHINGALHSTAVSSKGQVSFTVKNHNGSYTLVVADVPEGYTPQKDSYTYRADSGAIVLNIVPVIYPNDHSKAAYEVGSTMGDFSVTDIDGKTYQLSQLLQEKKLVMLNFWYYNCVPCKAEFPYFNSICQRYGDDIEILAMNHIDNESLIRQLRSNMDLRFPLISEHLGFQKGFDIRSYPFSVFIGSDGRILHIRKDMAFLSEAELDDLVRQLIGR